MSIDPSAAGCGEGAQRALYRAARALPSSGRYFSRRFAKSGVGGDSAGRQTTPSRESLKKCGRRLRSPIRCTGLGAIGDRSRLLQTRIDLKLVPFPPTFAMRDTTATWARTASAWGQAGELEGGELEGGRGWGRGGIEPGPSVRFGADPRTGSAMGDGPVLLRGRRKAGTVPGGSRSGAFRAAEGCYGSTRFCFIHSPTVRGSGLGSGANQLLMPDGFVLLAGAGE